MEELNYRQEGEYLVPDLEGPAEYPAPGKYGRMRQRYLMEHRPGTYSALLLEGKLPAHLAEIDGLAREQAEQTVLAMAQAAGVDEALKARDMMAWVGAMNNFKHSAEETVLKDLIHV